MSDLHEKPGVTSFPAQDPQASGEHPTLTVVSVSRHHQINTLTLSDGSVLNLPHALFEQSPWRTGLPITIEGFESWLSENEYAACMERAGRSLSGRNHTEKELEETLRQAGFRDTCVNRVLARLTQVGYIDDAAFAVSWVRHRMSSGYGGNRIRQELRMKGVDEKAIQAALARNEDGPLTAARLAAEKAARGKDLSSYKDRQKVKAALARRGFSFDLIDTVLTELAGTVDEDEAFDQY